MAHTSTKTVALSFDTAVIGALSMQFEKAKSISQNVEKAREALHQEAPKVERELRTARVLVDKTSMELDGIREICSR
ncbi:hypothetical protein PtrSN002B_009141 [Pyrenophora tritici-repentis]|uniref:Uncharacterized protein n=1 Tax=Pyrenophora tritici-repentis TaxID=45151 RepID=A0A317AY65_9PLEO|nr:hypothetical protein PtrV1_12569 [Pyrenophora tritici-repentis]KAF7445381.1 hypothetical protein A1F99_103670 [Pyrenophora tritici-repentis]KAF7565646.1 hypothetical protein PtrM4_050800 [Pyrenophora tritici-repentis]KAI0572545.1 hypothetical protein Alg130_10460 [Pyrenophora tritici-repentis]KAI0606083.1 hypothetical protein TUN205_09672 [Pyrenophora tritici-repentis]